MNLSNLIIHGLSISILGLNVLFIIVLALFIFSKRARQAITKYILEKPIEHLFFFSLLATLGSLSLSNIIGFPPCDLCWFQRIFMYPQALITFIALLRKKYSQSMEVVRYSLWLSLVGFCISLYQSYIQWGGTHSVLPCTLDGGACGKLYIYAYGYITIPFMALTVFVYLVSICLVSIYGSRKK